MGDYVECLAQFYSAKCKFFRDQSQKIEQDFVNIKKCKVPSKSLDNLPFEVESTARKLVVILLDGIGENIDNISKSTENYNKKLKTWKKLCEKFLSIVKNAESDNSIQCAIKGARFSIDRSIQDTEALSIELKGLHEYVYFFGDSDERMCKVY